MDADTIIFLTNALAIGVLLAGVLYTTAKGLPLATTTVQELKRLILELLPPMRRLFDPNTALSKALQAKGVNPEMADKLAELGADVIEMLLGAAPEEAQPKAG